MAGEIFRSDLTGDGTVGDLLPETHIGSTGKYSTSSLTQVIQHYDSTYAGQLTPAGNALMLSHLFSEDQLLALDAYAPTIQGGQGLPLHFAQATWLKTMDLRLEPAVPDRRAGETGTERLGV